MTGPGKGQRQKVSSRNGRLAFRQKKRRASRRDNASGPDTDAAGADNTGLGKAGASEAGTNDADTDHGNLDDDGGPGSARRTLPRGHASNRPATKAALSKRARGNKSMYFGNR